MTSPLERLVQGAFAFSLVCVGAIGVVSWFAVERQRADAVWVDHTREITVRLEELFSNLTDAQNGHRGYVLTGDERFIEPYRHALDAAPAEVREIQKLTADNPDQQQQARSLAMVVDALLDRSRQVIETRRAQGLEGGLREALSGKGKELHDDLRRVIDQMKAKEEILLAQRQRQAQRSSVLTQRMIAGGGGLAFVIVSAALFGMLRNFSGRRRAEAELIEARATARAKEAIYQSEARYRVMFETLIEGFCTIEMVFDANGEPVDYRFLEINPAFEKQTGLHNAQGKSMRELAPDHETHWFEIYGKVARTGESVHFENEAKALGRHYDVRAWRVGGPESRKVAILFSDITEQKSAQRKLQAQLERLNLLQQITRAIGERQDLPSIFQVVIRTVEDQLPVDFCCICLYEAAGKRLTVTSVGLRSHDLAMELAMSENAEIAIDENGLSRALRGHLVYEPDIGRVSFPFPQRLAKGGLGSLVAAPLLVESQVFGVLVAARREPHSFSSGECEFLRQLSEHVALAAHQAQLHQALQKAYDELRQTQQAVMHQERLRALGQMASGIAHDINNAITPVTLYTESLLESEPQLDPRSRDYLETIQRAIGDVAQTVARMREFYRQGEPEVAAVPVDLNRLIPQVIDLTRARWSDMAQERGVAIRMGTDLAPDLPAIAGSESEIREALTNLIFNAVDAMPQGGTLTLRTLAAGEDSLSPKIRGTRRVCLEVSDTGIGMDEETRRRCLEPFFTTKGERGTGLGLAMVYGFAQRHGADLEIDSAVNEGTTMRLCFPVPAATAAQSTPSTALPAIPLPLRILIVDDDPVLLKSLRDALQTDGHHVTATHGGQAGIDAFRAANEQGPAFDIVITDLGMPHVDGRKVANAVKTLAPAMPLILLTGWGQRLVVEGDIPANVDRVLSKPPKLRDLREALAALASARLGK